MRNRGIPHDTPIWVDNGNGTGSWVVHTKTQLFGSVQVDIPGKSNSETLTDVQQRSLDMLRDLPTKLKPMLFAALRRYASEYLDDNFDDDDCTLSCDNASVPYLHESKTPYIFLNADSNIDDEHGVCFLIRDGDVISCCHGDASLEFLGWDATDDLDELANGIG